MVELICTLCGQPTRYTVDDVPQHKDGCPKILRQEEAEESMLSAETVQVLEEMLDEEKPASPPAIRATTRGGQGRRRR